MAGLYVHVPFCLKKCPYCDFASVPVQSDLQAEWLQAVRAETVLRAPDWKPIRFDTLYFGGGTPSLLDPADVAGLIDLFSGSFQWARNPEITLEANPGTLSGSKLRDFRKAGINRLSIGIQSFRDEELQLLGRMHDAAEAENSLARTFESGFENVNADFIYGLPGQTPAHWSQTLGKAVAFPLTHISAYCLTWSGKTELGRKIESGEVEKPSEAVQSDLFLRTSSFLAERHFQHYEISNFSLEGRRCRHNEGYWKGNPYLGLGPSSHSFTGRERYWNVSDTREYCRMLNQGLRPCSGSETLSRNDIRLETIALRLRTSEGLPLAMIQNKTDFCKVFLENGLARIRGDRLVLTENGFLMADELALRLTV
ncbi:radical SAM family heme chaperone HemW [bacterium]|nr:radical SAM family heme chaperone HemW [bacterium]